MKRASQVAILGVLGAIVVLLALAVPGFVSRGSIIDRVGKGEKPVAPNFNLPGLRPQDAPVELANLRGRPVVVNFWASWCAACADEAPLLEDLARKYGARVSFVGVNRTDDAPGAAVKFATDYGLSFALVRDRDSETFRRWGLEFVPETLVLDGEGRVVKRLIDISSGALERALAEAGAP